jgi:hypothetical protein
LFDKQDTKFVNIKSFVDSQDNPEMPSWQKYFFMLS